MPPWGGATGEKGKLALLAPAPEAAPAHAGSSPHHPKQGKQDLNLTLAPFKYWKAAIRSPCSLLFSQPVIIGEVLQPSDCLCGPPLNLLQQLHVLLVLGTPELDRGLQVGSH